MANRTILQPYRLRRTAAAGLPITLHPAVRTLKASSRSELRSEPPLRAEHHYAQSINVPNHLWRPYRPRGSSRVTALIPISNELPASLDTRIPLSCVSDSRRHDLVCVCAKPAGQRQCRNARCRNVEHLVVRQRCAAAGRRDPDRKCRGGHPTVRD